MGQVSQALKMQREAQRKRLLAPENDPIWREFDLRCATDLERQSAALLRPLEALKTGAGGEKSRRHRATCLALRWCYKSLICSI